MIIHDGISSIVYTSLRPTHFSLLISEGMEVVFGFSCSVTSIPPYILVFLLISVSFWGGVLLKLFSLVYSLLLLGTELARELGVTRRLYFSSYVFFFLPSYLIVSWAVTRMRDGRTSAENTCLPLTLITELRFNDLPFSYPPCV
ncbi:hypothetical protein FN846DRAFT_171529 [Sphaerosporella brunnea]|uniref:Uncharacterized protein n=1 Tax=Sphaerosporella brunnea TaxID=1250544 RepID=A0A5J5EPT8_9PEZI|nr:hypothetical protein FN846DRAFT_171529 [Sphaerosporella brunnea]